MDYTTMKVGPWTSYYNGPADTTPLVRFRALEGMPAGYSNHIVMIEKTPRIRIDNSRYTLSDRDNWIYSERKGSGPSDERSRMWCDMMLELLGYQV